MTDLRYFSPDVTVCVEGGGGAFLPNFQTKLKFDKMSIYSLKLTKLCINKYFAGVKSLHNSLKPC